MSSEAVLVVNLSQVPVAELQEGSWALAVLERELWMQDGCILGLVSSELAGGEESCNLNCVPVEPAEAGPVVAVPINLCPGGWSRVWH